MQRSYLFLLFLLLGLFSYSQDIDLNTSAIPEHLLKNADAVIRKSETKIIIEDYDEYVVITNRIVSVFNESGMRAVSASQCYDNFIDIRDISAVIYDEFGEKIEKYKKKEFKNVSAVSNGTLYSDNRVLYLEYTPRSYPVTIHYESEVTYNSTAFFPGWYPVGNFNTSTQFSRYSIENKSDVALKIKESNFEAFHIEKKNPYAYEAKDLPALKAQSSSPNFSSYAPNLLVTLEKFKMEGVDGVNSNWKSFGKWMHDNLLSQVGEIPQSVKTEIKSLVKEAKTEREKAVIVYKFMQDRSRYISVQVGIGGWKPINATEVHEKAYGDCKGLTNYTKALLAEVGIQSDHAVIYGSRGIRSIDREFSSTQGNHMILYIPVLDDDRNVWLECTSKTSPFGYIAGFTDDRDALVVSNDGGTIIHTTVYSADESKQLTTATVALKPTGYATGNLEMKTTGFQYSLRDYMSKKKKEDAKRHYQNRWDNLNGLVINEVGVLNDVNNIEFTETVSFKIEKLANKMGDILLISPVLFNKSNYEPPSYEERLYLLELDRGYLDIDEYTITLDPSIQIDALPESVKIETDFGTYELIVTSNDAGGIKVSRYLKMNNGLFNKDRYDEYEKFRTDIVKYDDSKAALKILK
jgi:hypothetical protein